MTPEEIASLKELRAETPKMFKPFLEEINDGDKVYSHHDEYPNNFRTGFFSERYPIQGFEHPLGDLRSIFLDPANAMFDNGILSDVKIITNPLTRLGPIDQSDLFESSLEMKKVIKKELQKIHKLPIEPKGISDHKSRRSFHLISIYEAIAVLGRRSGDFLLNRGLMERYTSQIVKYENPLIFPYPQMSYGFPITFEDHEHDQFFSEAKRKIEGNIQDLKSRVDKTRLTKAEKDSIETSKKMVFDLLEV